jgi:hypothetical protein
VALRLTQPLTLGFLALTVIITCALAGWYPARMLSGFLPVLSLRGQGIRQLNGKSRLRKGLIVFQFTISLGFIIATMVVGRQMHYMLNTDLGFNKDAILNIDLPGDQGKAKKKVFAEQVAQLAGVQRVSLSNGSPEAKDHAGTYLEYKGAVDTRIDASLDIIDTNFIRLYNLTILAGRNIFPGDSLREYILNEAAAKALGFRHPTDALGQQVSSGFGGDIGPVVAILKDYHTANYHQAIGPHFLTANKAWGSGNLLSVQLTSAARTPAQARELLDKMETVFKKVYPESTFNARLFDEVIAKLYAKETRTAQIMNLAMAIAIFISCMGLFGLAAFSATQRTREIGIRKVLGAGVPQLVSLLTRDFVGLVLLATLIAGPIAGWAMHRWLHDFVYRTTVPWWIYLAAGAGAVLIAVLTVSIQAIRAATINPVDSLRSE